MRAAGLILLIYILVGVIVALSQGYFSGLGNLNEVLEAIVAVFIWPALLFGVDVNIGGGAPEGGM